MQVPITVEKNLFPIKVIKEFHGETVPFEVETFQKDFANSERGGIFDLSHWGVVEISGPDAAGYLQRMSTANIQHLVVGSSSLGTFLTGKGTVVALGTFLRPGPERFLFVVSANQTERVLTHLELFHFQEKLEIKDRTTELAVLGLWKINEPILEASWTNERESRLSFVLKERAQAERDLIAYGQKGLSLLGMQLFHFFRIQSGLPWMGWEVRESDLVLEASLDDFVARNKGCYPGQEVVERIFTYGQVNRKLLKVELEGAHLNQVGEAVEIKNSIGENVGLLMSALNSPQRANHGLGLAYVRKSFWKSQEEFQTDSGLIVKLRGFHE